MYFNIQRTAGTYTYPQHLSKSVAEVDCLIAPPAVGPHSTIGVVPSPDTLTSPLFSTPQQIWDTSFSRLMDNNNYYYHYVTKVKVFLRRPKEFISQTQNSVR